MDRLWIVEMTTHIVVRADSEKDAKNVAASCAWEENEPTTVDATELTSLDDLEGGWDENCIPYSESYIDDKTLGELLGK